MLVSSPTRSSDLMRRPTHPWRALSARLARHNLSVAPALLVVALGALLAACGAAGGDSGATGATGSPTPNTSAPTSTPGPIVIASDHSTYSPTEAMRITVTNQLSAPIYAFDTQSGCSILNLQISHGGQWVPANAAHCPLGRAAQPVAIAPGATYTATITANTQGLPGSGASYFTPGQYRFALNYYTKSPASGDASHSTVTYSATLTVVGPVPNATPVHPAGTVVGRGTISPGGTITITPTK